MAEVIGILDDLDRGFIGDPVIHHGLMNVLLPGLGRSHAALKVGGGPLDDAQKLRMVEALEKCSYVVKAGTPSWYRDYDEWCWRLILERGCPRISFLGVGTAIGELTTPDEWHAHSGFIKDAIAPLLRSWELDIIVCRDILAERMFKILFKRAGLRTEGRLFRLPCPGFFSVEQTRVREEAKVVALDVADHRRCSKATATTFDGYYDKLNWLRRSLEKRGYEVRPQTHERSLEYVRNASSFRDVIQFGSRKEMIAHYDAADVYVGAKVHGALPCAGSGAPALLLGVDGRQSAAWEIPDIECMDMESGRWHPARIVAWIESLDVPAVSRRLLSFRERKIAEWRRIVRERTPLGWACE